MQALQVARVAMGLGCVKTPKSNLRVEISSPFHQWTKDVLSISAPGSAFGWQLMPPIILDGKILAQRLERELAVRVQVIKQRSNGISPILATILVGDDPSSATYVKMKCRAQGLPDIVRSAAPLDAAQDTAGP